MLSPVHLLEVVEKVSVHNTVPLVPSLAFTHLLEEGTRSEDC
jgi:hypothetical protein